jgi:diketogulonate reductase-like aldo/keto reductase
LRELRVDYIDVLFVHEPPSTGGIHEELLTFLGSAMEKGLIRSWGISGDGSAVADLVRTIGHRIPVVQIREDIYTQEPDTLLRPLADRVFSYGPLSSALNQLRHFLHINPDRVDLWSEATGLDCHRAENLAAALVQWAVHQGHDKVIFSSTCPAHISEIAAVVAQPNLSQGQIRHLAELASGAMI